MDPNADYLRLLSQQKLIWTNEEGSFAHNSFLHRLPELVLDVAKLNHARLRTGQRQQLLTLSEAMQNNMPLLQNDIIKNASSVSNHSQEYISLIGDSGYTWLSAPWFLAEMYMFHLILLITDYYETGLDPFKPSKMVELEDASVWDSLEKALQFTDSCNDGAGKLRSLIKLDLWANKADGCYKQVRNSLRDTSTSCTLDDKFLLVDDSNDVIDYLKTRRSHHQIHFINDNSGAEILLDLALADHLLTNEWCSEVVFHTKAEPMFVSDATPTDVVDHIKEMASQSHITKMLGHRLTQFLQEKKLQIRQSAFWNQYAFYHEFPSSILDQLMPPTSLVIIKGDLNYRRLLGDRMWPATTPIETAIPYFPTSFVALRTLKSYPIVGLDASTVTLLNAQSISWRDGGIYGVIQCVLKYEMP